MKERWMEDIESRGSEGNCGPLPWQAQILTLISELAAVPMDLLAEFLSIDRRVAVRLMEEFTGHGWVKVRQFFVNDEPWVWLVHDGRDRGVDHSVGAPRVSDLPYHRAVCEVRLALEREHPDGRWLSGRSPEHQKDDYRGLPDAVFHMHDSGKESTRWAIVIECTGDDAKRNGEVAARWCERYDRVLIYCTAQLTQTLEAIPEFNHHKVTVNASLTDASALENFQWKMPPAPDPDGEPARDHIEPWEAKIVRLIAEQDAMPVDQLARFLERDFIVAQRIANRLDRAGFVCQALGPAGERPWLWVTAAGARLAETGLKAVAPSLFGLHEIRLVNEARLYMQDLSPNGQWWSRRMLLRGSRNGMTPAGVVREGDKEYAVEIEADSLSRGDLTAKYKRLYAEHRSEKRGAIVLCTTGTIGLLEELKERCGWTNLFVDSCAAFDSAAERSANARNLMPLVHVDPSDVPEEVLRAIQLMEGIASMPPLELAGRRQSRGFPRWRVTTEFNVWSVVVTPLGCCAKPANEQERAEELPIPEPEEAAQEHEREFQPPRTIPVGMRDAPPGQVLQKVLAGSLPIQALEAIQAAATLTSPPAVISVERHRTARQPRWRVETDAGLWWVTKIPRLGWAAKRADSRGRPIARWMSERRSPRDPVGVMKPIDLMQVPAEALDAIQKAAGSPTPPRVLSASKRRGKGAPRWRIETDMDNWRVTLSPHGWRAGLSE